MTSKPLYNQLVEALESAINWEYNNPIDTQSLADQALTALKAHGGKVDVGNLKESLEKTEWANSTHNEKWLHEKRPVIPTDVYQDRIRNAAKAHLEFIEGGA